jgi:hypothetical protein
MKKVLLSLFLTMPCMVCADTGAPNFISIVTDKPTYVLGDQATITVDTLLAPQNFADRIYLQGKVDGVPVNLVFLSDVESAFVSPAFTVVGNVDFEVDVYLENVQNSTALNEGIAYYQTDITNLNAQLAATSDPTQIAALQAQIQRDQTLVSQMQENLMAERRLVEIDHQTIAVTAESPELRKPRLVDSPILTITFDHSDSTYHPGESAAAQMSVLSDFDGSDGPEEIVVRAKLDGSPIAVTNTSETQFNSVIGPFSQNDLGAHELSADVFIRPQYQVAVFRSSISQAEALRNIDISNRDLSNDPKTQAYYNLKIQELDQIISAFYQRLESILTPVGNGSATITISEQKLR